MNSSNKRVILLINHNRNIEIHSFLQVFLFYFLSIFLSIPLTGQNDSLTRGTQIDKRYVFSYWHDTKSIVTEPFHWKGKQWFRFAGVAGLGLVAYAYDQEIFEFSQQHNSKTSDYISKYFLEPWGSGLYSIPLLAGIYLTASGNSRHRLIALTGVKAYVLSGGAAFVSKHLFHRHRPGDDDPPDPRQWEGPFPFTTTHTAFPSAHATTAFAIATVLAMGYRDRIWVGITSYTLAGLVSVSRIHDARHWGSDAVAGAALGFFIGATLSKINLRNVRLEPAALNGGQGIKICLAID